MEELARFLREGGSTKSKKFKDLFSRHKEKLTEIFREFYPDNPEVQSNVVAYILTHGEPPKCPMCESPCDLKEKGREPFKKYCSKECASKGRVETFKENFVNQQGVDNPSKLKEINDKRKNTLKEIYGVDNPMAMDKVKKKRMKTFHDTGRTGPLSSEDSKKKYEQTCMEKYGVRNSMSCKEVKQKRNETIASKSDEWRQEVARKQWDTKKKKSAVDYGKLDDPVWMKEQYESGKTGHQIAFELNVNSQTVYNRLAEYGIELRSGINDSVAESAIADYVESLGFEVERNVKGLFQESPRSEIDVYIPSIKFGIEFNGLRWHSTFSKKDRNYHAKKQDMADNAGIRLFTVWEDDWESPDTRSIVLKSLSHKLGKGTQGVYARKCEVDFHPNSSDVFAFLDNNHIQGKVVGCKNIVLRDGEAICAAISYKTHGDALEIVRYASSGVVGGFSKLLKAMIRDNPHAVEVFTFADRMVSDGGLYEKSGFVHTHTTKPSYWYTEGHYRVNKQHFRRHRLESLKQFDPQLSESDNARLNGFYQIFDAGLKRYSLDLTPS